MFLSRSCRKLSHRGIIVIHTSSSPPHLGDLVHVGVVVGGRGSLGSSRGGSAVGLVTTEVVLHLSIELFGSLGLRLASTTSLLLVGACLSSTSSSTVGGTLLALGGALGLLLGGGLGLAVKDVRRLASSFWRNAVYSRNAVAKALCNCCSRNALGTHDNLDLELVSEDPHIGTHRNAYLHRTVVNLDPVQLVRGLSSTSRLGEDDSGGATAAASRAVREHDLLDGSHRFAEVVLNEVPC